MILDGAHNPAAVDELLETWSAACGQQPYHLIFGALADKEVEPMARRLSERAAAISIVKVSNERGMDPKQLQGFFDGVTTQIFDSVAEALAAAQQGTRPILVTGSLFLVAEVLGILQGRTMDDLNESGLAASGQR
jgi:dihydrofolate synthase/folylpolyglutamate synthase